MLKGKHAVGRVIARPFVGTDPSNFQRTLLRRDYPLIAPSMTTMDHLIAAGKVVYGTGKIDDLFGRRGLTGTQHCEDNFNSIQGLLKYLEEDFEGLIFSNLIEFDMIYGYRNDAQGYARALQDFDRVIPKIRRNMRPTDIAMIVADHGVDPTTPGTDHSCEFNPLLVFGDQVRGGVNLGTRKSYADVVATLADIFALDLP
jgi:phosphopentomutase